MKMDGGKEKVMGMLLAAKKGGKKKTASKSVNGPSGYELGKKKPKNSKRTMLASALM